MSHYQVTPRRDASKQSAVARRLLKSSVTPAPHVLASTLEVDMQGRQVRGAVAYEPMQVGRISIAVGQHFWFVASKFEGRAYVVTEDGQCSATDERVAFLCIAKVQAKVAA